MKMNMNTYKNLYVLLGFILCGFIVWNTSLLSLPISAYAASQTAYIFFGALLYSMEKDKNFYIQYFALNFLYIFACDVNVLFTANYILADKISCILLQLIDIAMMRLVHNEIFKK